MSGFGDFNTTDLTLNLGGSTDGFVTPSTGEFSTTGSNVDFFTGITSAPTFGTGGASLADSTTGQGIGYSSSLGPLLLLPTGYISQQPITDSATYANQTLASLGITPGTYVYTWGTGANADSMTINAVPEPSTYAAIGGLAALGLAVLRRRVIKGEERSK